MTPRWPTIEKLVAELGSACSSRYEIEGGAAPEAGPPQGADAALEEATRAVTSVLGDPVADDDAVVREAWVAIARAQDAIAALRETMARSRALRDQALTLQDRSLRWRGADPRGGSRRSGPTDRRKSRG